MEPTDTTATTTTTNSPPTPCRKRSATHSPYNNRISQQAIDRRLYAAIMPDVKHISGAQPPTSPKGHPLPRRSSPENSVTLQHHRLARQASETAASSRAAAAASSGSSASPRRQSSGESHNTGPSDPKRWFDQNNENPTAEYSNAMDGKSYGLRSEYLKSII